MAMKATKKAPTAWERQIQHQAEVIADRDRRLSRAVNALSSLRDELSKAACQIHDAEMRGRVYALRKLLQDTELKPALKKSQVYRDVVTDRALCAFLTGKAGGEFIRNCATDDRVEHELRPTTDGTKIDPSGIRWTDDPVDKLSLDTMRAMLRDLLK